MGRVHFMTLGMVLVCIGIQFYMVKTYVMTPQATEFMANRLTDLDLPGSVSDMTGSSSPTGFNSGFSQGAYNPQQGSGGIFSNSSYRPNDFSATMNSNSSGSLLGAPRKEITPPSWLKWAAMFLGAVLFLHGAAIPRI